MLDVINVIEKEAHSVIKELPSGTKTNIGFPIVFQRSTSLTLKLWLLEHFDLPDVDVVQGIDGLACLLNVLANTVWDPGSNQKHTKSIIFRWEHTSV